MYRKIENQKDIDYFLEEVNGLHDGYLIGVSYVHNGHGTGNPHWIDPEKTELRLCYQITSIWDVVAELEFRGIRAWCVRDNGYDVLDCRVELRDGDVIWSEDGENGSFVRAREMVWRLALPPALE